ncbi:hypothetical protein ACEWY4_002160 [Coilia grayii]|uniref:T-complex protein 11-like protein 2 n=1 Tax=Coilia grayii TaxID=363190 RepID=A0ABD1KV16_9TELE
MPLQDERPTSTSTAASEDQSSDTELSDRCDSMTSASDYECSRQSFTSDSSKHSSPSTSPPKTITMDEVMASARNLCNLRLAHEIIVDRGFRVEPSQLPEHSLQKKVKDIIHQTFWNRLESDLNDDPPEYEHAIKLLEDIRGVLLSFLNPGANRMRTQIMEVLDVDLIRQQADNDAVDIKGLATYVINTMGKMCAPVRDEEIKKLRESPDDIVSLFKEIFRVLDLMTMDYVNATIQMIRPELQKHSVEYEREKFQNILQTTPSALNHTSAWIKASLEEAMQAMPPAEKTADADKAMKALPSPILVINTAFVRFIMGTHNGPLPETLMTDEARLVEMQRRAQVLQAVAAILLIVYSSTGEAFTGLPALTERLKRMTTVLLEGMHSPSFNLAEALENTSVQICCELNKSLAERGLPGLPPPLQQTLKGQMGSITQDNNPIRALVEGRFQQYFRVILSIPISHTNPPPVPSGLGLIQPELTALGIGYAGFASFNKQVYMPFYMGIIKDLLFGTPPQEGGTGASGAPTQESSSSQSPAKQPVASK